METTAITMFNKTIKYCEDVIFIQPVCEFFEIEYDYQCRRIKASTLLATSAGKNPSMLLFGDQRERVTLTKQGFIAWILQINPKIVHVTLREKLLQYQTLIFDFMFGSIKKEEQHKINYARLNKLKKLKSKITSEIASCEEKLDVYLNSKYEQTALDL